MENPLIVGVPGETADPRISDVLARPLWTVEDISILLNLPISTVRLIVKDTPIENGTIYGRQIRFFPHDVREWFLTMQKKHPYTPRVNNTKGKS